MSTLQIRTVFPPLAAVSMASMLLAGCATDTRRVDTVPVYRSTTDVISSPPPASATVVVPPASTPTTVVLTPSDRALISNVQDAARRIGHPGLEVTASRGVVTVRGDLPNEAGRQRLIDAVRATPGVHDVIDHLTVSTAGATIATVPAPTGGESSRTYAPVPARPPAASSTARAASASSSNLQLGEIFSMNVETLKDQDRELAQRIIEGLRTDQALTVLIPRVKIGVADGRVNLTGTVQSDDQRRAIAAAVERAIGSSVENNLTVAKP